MEYLTPACAARLNTISIFFLKILINEFLFVKSVFLN